MRDITLSRQYLWILAFVVSILIVAHVATQTLKHRFGHDTQYGLQRLFNLNEENNVTAWYASSSLLLCSGVLTLIWRARRQVVDPDARYWGALAILFLYLSVDEAASLHENFAQEILLRIWPYLDTSSYLHYPWVVAGFAFVLLIGLRFLRFLFRLPSRTRLGFIVSGLVFVAGALGIDMLEAWYDAQYGVTYTYAMFVAVEEGMEMIGILIFLHTLFAYIVSDVGGLRLVLNAGPSEHRR